MALDIDDPAWLYRFKPKNVRAGDNKRLTADLPESVKSHLRSLISAGWNIYIVDQRRGYCDDRAKIITIPVFALNKTLEYKIWYLCHEMAHAIAGCKYNHGPEFMKVLQDICPKDCIEFELGYKPRNARAAGIGEITLEDI